MRRCVSLINGSKTMACLSGKDMLKHFNWNSLPCTAPICTWLPPSAEQLSLLSSTAEQCIALHWHYNPEHCSALHYNVKLYCSSYSSSTSITAVWPYWHLFASCNILQYLGGFQSYSLSRGLQGMKYLEKIAYFAVSWPFDGVTWHLNPSLLPHSITSST